MTVLLAVADPKDLPSQWSLDGYDLRVAPAVGTGALSGEVSAVLVVPDASGRVAQTVRAIEDARLSESLALLLAGRATEPAVAEVLRGSHFDGFIDLGWPPSLALACLETALRNVEVGRNVVEIQRVVLEQTRNETTSLYDLAVHDDLTKLYNHRHFAEMIAREHWRSRRRGEPYALVFIDLDDLKLFNTLHGHEGGSRALRELAAILADSLRSSDVALRLGGDEFVVFLPGCDKPGATEFARRLCERLRGHCFTVDQLPLSITISAGVASFPEDGKNHAELLRHADRALHLAKAGGKNRAVAWSPDDDGRAADHPRREA